MSYLGNRYGNIKDAELSVASAVFDDPNIATSIYYYPYSKCRMVCHCCMRRAEFSYPENQTFRLKVSEKEWKEVTAPLIIMLNAASSLCTLVRCLAWGPLFCLCTSTRGSWREPNPVRELNVFYSFIERHNRAFFNPRNMEVRLLITRPPPVGRQEHKQDHKLHLAIYMFNNQEELRAFPQPVVGVTPGYPTDGEQALCLWSYCPSVCCLPALDYRLKPTTGLAPPGEPFIPGRSLVPTTFVRDVGAYEEALTPAGKGDKRGLSSASVMVAVAIPVSQNVELATMKR